MVRTVIGCCAAILIGAIVFSGGLIRRASQVEPAPYYIFDTVHYQAPGPEFKLSREAAGKKAYKADRRGDQSRNY